MRINRRSAILQSACLAAVVLSPERYLRRSLLAAVTALPAEGPPLLIKLSVFGETVVLKAKSLSTPSERAFYTQMWFCHLKYGLVLSDPLVLDETGMTLRFVQRNGSEKRITVEPICSGHLIVNEQQRLLVLLTTVLLGSATVGNGFDREKKNEIFGIVLEKYREQTETAFAPAAKLWPEYWNTPRNSPRGQELFRILDEAGRNTVHTSLGSPEVTKWLLSLTPSAAQIRKDKFLGSLPQCYLDFHRFTNGWWALPVNLAAQLDDCQIVVRALDDWRQRSRLLTIGAAWKMLFQERQLPTLRIVVDREFAQLPKLAVSSDGKIQSVIPFGSLLPPGKDLNGVEGRKDAVKNRFVADLQQIYPGLDDPLEFLFYGLVASLALDGNDKAEVQLKEQMQIETFAAPSMLATPESLVLSDKDADPELPQCFAEPDWRWFSRWTQLPIVP